jgi:hypothetical protein
MSEPLTPEEEATLREYAKHHVRSDVDRLLATLDAARVAPSDGLREAAELVVRAYSMGQRRRYAALDTAIPALRAALQEGAKP